jgi:hypothetical protein
MPLSIKSWEDDLNWEVGKGLERLRKITKILSSLSRIVPTDYELTATVLHRHVGWRNCEVV